MTAAPFIQFETPAKRDLLRGRLRPATPPRRAPAPACRIVPDGAELIADCGRPPDPWGWGWWLILALLCAQMVAVAANANELPRRFRPGRPPTRIVRIAQRANGVRALRIGQGHRTGNGKEG